MNKKVLAFGEVLLRLSTPGFRALDQADYLEIYIGGAELNVCAALVLLGIHASILTVLPRNLLGLKALEMIREVGVSQTHIELTSKGKMGLYFLESGAFPRTSKVLYDRTNTAFSLLKTDDAFWDERLVGFDHFHSTGITPAIVKNAADNLERAMRSANKHGVPVSFDVNYRSLLWGVGKARKVLAGICGRVDHLIVPRFELERIFGYRDPNPTSVAADLIKKFALKTVAVTEREEASPGILRWRATAFDGERAFESPAFEARIVDPVGAGDAFSAGYIAGILRNDPELGVRVGSAMAALKLTLPGDCLKCSRDEIEDLAALRGRTQIQR